KVAEFLNERGLALVHSMVEERETSPDAWIDRNFFPGGYIPTISEVASGVEGSNCQILKIWTHDKLNYFRTLESWKDRLFDHRAQCENRLAQMGLSRIESAKIIRIWEYFLSSSQIAFSDIFGRCRVAQFLVTKKK